jgi:hypothetical protein
VTALSLAFRGSEWRSGVTRRLLPIRRPAAGWPGTASAAAIHQPHPCPRRRWRAGFLSADEVGDQTAQPSRPRSG